MNNKIKVLVVDDSAVVRQTMEDLLSSDPQIEVIATASDPFIAAERIKRELPDVITLDVEMPRMDGITFLHKIMSQHPIIQMAASIALNHHERWDGTGYPAGLKGDDIPIEGMIVMLADQYDALRSNRPYKSGLSHEEAVKIITGGDERTEPGHFHPDVLKMFIQNSGDFDEIFIKGSSISELEMSAFCGMDEDTYCALVKKYSLII